MSLAPEYKTRLNDCVEKYKNQLSDSCKDAVERLVESDVNKDIYAFIIFLRTPHYYMNISINSESVWQEGHGSVDDIDPFELSLKGLRYDNIGYECGTHCRDVVAEMDGLLSDVFTLVEDCRIHMREPDSEEAEAEAFLDEIQLSLHDIAIAALLNTDFSAVNKTPDFCPLVINHELDFSEQVKLAMHTVAEPIKEKFSTLFPELQRRESQGVDEAITTLPDEQQAEALVTIIIDHHLKLNHYEGSNRFSELLDAEVRLIQLRPISDPYIAKAINEFGPQVKTYAPGSKEAEEHGFYNKEFHIVNALLDMATYSDAPVTEVLEQALNRHINFLDKNMPSDESQSMSLLFHNALNVWKSN